MFNQMNQNSWMGASYAPNQLQIPNNNQTPVQLPGQEQGGFFGDLMSTAFDKRDSAGGMQQGWMSPVTSAIGTGVNALMGMKQMGMAKDQMAFQKNAWQEQFNMQKSEFDYARKRRDERRATYDIMKSRV